MEEFKISRNIILCKDDRFGSFDVDVIAQIFKDVDINFSKALQVDNFSSCSCKVRYREEGPMCSLGSSGHIIYLSTKENYWSQWLYQFAHEYCHHLINEATSSDVEGLMWLEETVCELSSMYHLYLASSTWTHYSIEFATFAGNHLSYLKKLLNKNLILRKSMQLHGFLSQWLPILDKPQYERNAYNAMAAEMLPLFIENPHLWKIILHFGDMTKRKSLEELFADLKSQATDDYKSSLLKLENLLFY